MSLSVSIIICAFNSAKRISKTLEHLAYQKFNNSIDWEIILVNNASTDDTSNIAIDAWNYLGNKVPLRIINESKPGKANALITGYNAAKYDLLLLCDDDNWLNENYIQTAVDISEKYPEVGLLGGYGSEAYLGENVPVPDWFIENQQSYVVGNHLGLSGFLPEGIYYIWGAGSVFKKSIWDWLYGNGFRFKNSTDAGRAQVEDAELAYMISLTGYKLYFDESLTFIHDLSGDRVFLDGFISQLKLNGKNSSWLSYYTVLAQQHKFFKSPNIQFFLFFYFKKLVHLTMIYFLVFMKFLVLKKSVKFNRNYASVIYNKYYLIYYVLNLKKFLKVRNTDYSVITAIYKKTYK